MNKKFSTLMTMGLLMAGSLVSVANAIGEVTLPIGSAVTEFKSGAKYFVVQDDDASLDATNSFLLGFAKDANDDKKVVDASTQLQGATGAWTTKATTTSITELEAKSYIWTITESKVGTGGSAKYYYTFTNASTGKVLTIKGAKDAETLVTDYTSPAAQATTGFVFGTASTAAAYTGGVILTYENATAAHGFKLEETTTTFNATGSNFYLYEVAPTTVEASELNDAASGPFTLKYDKSTNNPFAGSLRAFDVSGVSGAVDGTYFATSWPSSLNGKDAITDLADFKKCTFIAANPQSNYKINDLNIDGVKVLALLM